MTTLRIVQLYPDLLGVTGDRGNVDVLAARARFAGHEADIVRIGMGDQTPDVADAIVIGNGPLSALRAVREDLSGRAAWLAGHVAQGATVLAVGAGAELLSERIELLDGSRLDGLALVPARVTRTRQRRVGYVLADTPDGRLVGFEDHASEWSLLPGAAESLRYGRVVSGTGSIVGGGETLRSGGLYATNVQGPVLPLNPQLADAMLTTMLARHGSDYVLGAEHARVDAHAQAARAEIERLATGKRFTAIQL